MDRQLTLGSLFDGSGGFPLGGLLCGITPLWASEIEPFPIRVTTKRLPWVKHLGDISCINGAEIEPVDIITFGSPCTDLSIAGRRDGLTGKQSSLFFEAIRIIKEMREASNGIHPRFIIWENVPGAFSSNGSADFRQVLTEIVRIAEPQAPEVPAPDRNAWPPADVLLGDGWSLAYRVIDAAAWVPQRRRRIYLVADFGSECAADILFERKGVCRDFAQGGFPWQGAPGGAAAGPGGAVSFEPGIFGRLGKSLGLEISGTLRAEMGDNQTAVAVPINTQVGLRNHKDGDGTGLGIGADGDPAYTLQAAHSHAVAVENHPADSRLKFSKDGLVQTLSSRMGTGGGNVPMVFGIGSYDSGGMKSSNPHAGIYEADTARALDGNGGNPACNQGGMAVVEPKTLKIRSGCAGGGKGPLVQNNLSATLSAHNDQTLFVPVAFTQNQRDEVRDLHNCAGALAAEPGMKQQTYILQQQEPVVYGIGNGQADQRPTPEMVGTLNCMHDQQAVIIDCRNHRTGAVSGTLQAKSIGGQSLNYINPVAVDCRHSRVEEICGTLQAKNTGGHSLYATNPVLSNYIVRRLTPRECAKLQGFPPDWCLGLGTPEPTEEDITFWSEVWETHRRIMGKSQKPKSQNQIIKWLRNPHTDSAEYRLWGNGVALPAVVFVMQGIVAITQDVGQ